MKSLSLVRLRARTCVSQRQDDPSRGLQRPRGRNLTAATFVPQWGQQTAEEKKCEARARSAANLVARPESMPSNIYVEFGARGKRFSA